MVPVEARRKGARPVPAELRAEAADPDGGQKSIAVDSLACHQALLTSALVEGAEFRQGDRAGELRGDRIDRDRGPEDRDHEIVSGLRTGRDFLRRGRDDEGGQLLHVLRRQYRWQTTGRDIRVWEYDRSDRHIGCYRLAGRPIRERLFRHDHDDSSGAQIPVIGFR